METDPNDIPRHEHEYNVRMAMKICNEIAELDKEIAHQSRILEGLQDQQRTLKELLDVYTK